MVTEPIPVTVPVEVIWVYVPMPLAFTQNRPVKVLEPKLAVPKTWGVSSTAHCEV